MGQTVRSYISYLIKYIKAYIENLKFLQNLPKQFENSAKYRL